MRPGRSLSESPEQKVRRSTEVHFITSVISPHCLLHSCCSSSEKLKKSHWDSWEKASGVRTADSLAHALCVFPCPKIWPQDMLARNIHIERVLFTHLTLCWSDNVRSGEVSQVVTRLSHSSLMPLGSFHGLWWVLDGACHNGKWQLLLISQSCELLRSDQLPWKESCELGNVLLLLAVLEK